MESSEFDRVPLLDTTIDEESRTRRRPTGRSRIDVKPLFQMSDEEFQKLSMYRSQQYSGPFTVGGVFWMISSIAVLYYTNLPIVIKVDDRVDWFWMYMSLLMLGICLVIAAYFICYLSWYNKVHSDLWEKHFPPGIPVATAGFLLFSLFLNMALWGVWKWFTPLILLTEFLGAITFLSIFP